MPFALTTSQIAGFLLIFLRIGAVLFTAPIFNSQRVPVQMRAAIALLLTFLLQPVIAPDGPQVASLPVFVLLAVREVVIGLVIGYTANLVFSIIEMAGDLQDTQAGFGFAGTVDPTMQRPGAVLGQFQVVLMWLVFLVANGHLLLMQAVTDSFQLVPIGKFAFTSAMTGNMLHLILTMLFIAIRISAPVLGAVLLSDLAMGILQRTAPQLNIIAVGFPIKITVAVAVTCLSLPFLIGALRDLVPFMGTAVSGMIR